MISGMISGTVYGLFQRTFWILWYYYCVIWRDSRTPYTR
jgi:hypothetical protein